MDAEDQLGGSVVGNQNGAIDRFPEGMRVLAVDDNPLCLKYLEFTLRQCHYEGLFLVLLLFYYSSHIVFLSCYSDFYLFLFLFFNKSFVGVDS
jgi:hypothetical protein